MSAAPFVGFVVAKCKVGCVVGWSRAENVPRADLAKFIGEARTFAYAISQQEEPPHELNLRCAHRG